MFTVPLRPEKSLKQYHRTRLSFSLTVFSATLLHMPSQVSLPFFTTAIPKFSQHWEIQLSSPAFLPFIRGLTLMDKKHRAHSELPQIKLPQNFSLKQIYPFIIPSSQRKVGFISVKVNFQLYTCFLPIPRSCSSLASYFSYMARCACEFL